MPAPNIPPPTEQWKPVVGYEGLYEVSNHGRVRSLARTTLIKGKYKEHTRNRKSKLLSPYQEKTGYLVTWLSRYGTLQRQRIHVLVLTAFKGACPSGMEACHFPVRNPSCNHINNLRWDTRKNNQADRVVHGTDCNGARSPLSRLKHEDVVSIKKALANGIPCIALAKRFKVDISTISCIKRNKTWKHV